MEISNARILLGILVENASRILFAGFGVNYAETTLFAVIALLREHPDLKDDFLSLVLHTCNLDNPGLLHEGELPIELIELVAHELRWEEIRNIAEDRIERKFSTDRSLVIGDISQRIIKAFDDDWEDKEFFKHYQRA